MIELGKYQRLQISKKNQFGAYLKNKKDKTNDEVLLPRKQVPPDAEIGDELEVYVYKDSEDRMIATVNKPRLSVGELAPLQVVETTRIGAFMDWGLEKDLLLPFKEQKGKVVKGGTYLVGLYVDKSDRLCATMNIYDMLSINSPHKEKERVQGIVFDVNKDFGAFVAVENKYLGLIPNKEIYTDLNISDVLEVRIKKVLPDGKLELSLRNEAYNEIEGDVNKIMDALKLNGGSLKLNDNSPPELIKDKMGMSKGAFKRAVGRLLKEGVIEITSDGIKMMW